MWPPQLPASASSPASAGGFKSFLCKCKWRRSDSMCYGVVEGLHLGADGSSVGVEIRRSSPVGVPQQGAPDSGQRHGQRLVVIVCGHVGDALATVAHVICGADVERWVIGGAAGAVTAPPPCGFGDVGGGQGKLWWRHGQRGNVWPVQAGDTAGVAGKVLLRNGGAVGPILLTAVVLHRQRENITFNTKVSNTHLRVEGYI